VLLQIALIVGLIVALFPSVRRRLERAVGRLFTVLLIGAVAFLAVVVLMH
jgi:uncharacterized membrane protein YccC